MRRILFALPVLLFATPAHASLFKGEALDTMANVLSWAVLVIVPAVVITVFWLLHIMPEKIAYKKHHPQAHAIHALCLLSLFFGGLLWPLAWLWTYTKPVFYKQAYGTDKVDHGHGDDADPVPVEDPPVKDHPIIDNMAEIQRLRTRLAELEGKPMGKSAAEGARV